LPRAAGAYVVLCQGQAVLYLERGGRSLLTLPAAGDPGALSSAVTALATLVTDGRLRALEVARVDGIPVADSPSRDALAGAGFRASYRGWVLRTPAR
jgi:ATP-dependent Lhr-like helicase